MARPRKPKKLAPGQLALICDVCDQIVTRGSVHSEGYLAIESGRWRAFHDQCKPATGLVVVREWRVSSYPLLLSTVAQLATELACVRGSNWPEFLRRIVADTEWYFDSEGGQMTAKELTEANRSVYGRAGFGQQMNVKGA
jgi:hypothetical protein